jgi:hypothetical protein
MDMMGINQAKYSVLLEKIWGIFLIVLTKAAHNVIKEPLHCI